jgi:glycosyltransferase involved in cell wall biosynthesis
LEILVLDGFSEDGTRDIVGRFAAAQTGSRAGPRAPVYLIDVPGRRRPAAVNAGIRQARGRVIARVDARTLVPPDYVERCVRSLLATGADNVGGVQTPVAMAPVQEAIGLAMSHPFGVGNARFRIGKKSGFVDTVYLGCFRRQVFDRIGLFDEESVLLSEDSDINQRIRESGGGVYLDAGIVVNYYPRESLAGLWRLYFRYGGARAGNLLKHGNLTSWRQVVPAAFLLSLASLGALSLVSPAARLAFWALLSLYVASDLAVSTAITARVRKPRPWPFLCAAFPCMHFGWALGFWKRLAGGRRSASSWAWTER